MIFGNRETARFLCFLLFSITAHTVVLWQLSVALLHRNLLTPLKIDLMTSASLQDGTSALDTPARASAPAFPQAPARAMDGLSGKAASSGSQTSAPLESNSADGATSAGGVVSSPSGEIAGEGSSSPSAGKSSGGGPASRGAATGSGLPGTPSTTAGVKTQPIQKETPSIDTILPKVRHVIHGDVYYDVDSYILEGLPVQGTNLCIEGAQLRTNDPITITDLVTDRSLCRIRMRGDELKEICPPAATKSVIRFAGHLRTPLSHSQNVCLVYDNSNCRIIRRGTDKEREICRPVRYEGVWAMGTNFEYLCQTSEVRTYDHPLEYTVRHLVDYETSDGKYRRKELRRVRHPIPQCQ
jgi:hypothetical protein